MNLCIDCKHCVVDNDKKFGVTFFCGHSKMLSKVDGKPTQSCNVTRNDGSNECGGPGRLWEKKP